MPRQSFTTSIGQAWTDVSFFGNTTTGTVADGRFCSESVSGTSRRKPEGWIPPTPYSFSRVRYDRAQGTAEQRFYEYGTYKGSARQSGCVGGAPGHNSTSLFDSLSGPLSVPTSFIDRALVRARLAMKDANVNLGVAFAERNATARMLGTNAKTLAEFFLNLRLWKDDDELMRILKRKFKRQNVRKTGSRIVNRFLETQYGWLPLLSDVYGACDALEKRTTSDWMVTGKGHYREESRVEKIIGSGLSRSWGVFKGERGAFVRIDAEPGNPLLGSLSSLGITNPALIAWEATRLSFVVDWAFSVGDWLESLDAMLGYNRSWCSTSSFTKGEWSYSGLGANHNPTAQNSSAFVNNFKASCEKVSVNRTVSQSVPLPSLPRFKDPRSLAHMANGLSLLAQAVSRL